MSRLFSTDQSTGTQREAFPCPTDSNPARTELPDALNSTMPLDFSDGLVILLIDNDPGDAGLVKSLLTDVAATPISLVEVLSLKAGIHEIRERSFDAIITDLYLPDSEGVGTLRALVEADENLPIVVMTHRDDPGFALEIVKNGAQDYLVKGQSEGALILKTLRYAIERKHAGRYVAFLSHYDKLTGLANRELFRDRLQQAMARADRNDRLVAVLFLGLDRFKAINESLGHCAGDELLVSVADRLTKCVRKVDAVARHGGDEFTVLIEEIEQPLDVETVCRKIIAAFKEPLHIQDREIYVTASIGIAFYPKDERSIDGLLRNADAAMYRAKKEGRNKYRWFTADLNKKAVDRMATESALRHAVDRGELFLCYQPKVSLNAGEVLGVEALLRWQRPDRGLVSPLDFIPIAEDTGLIVPIGEWVLRRACEDALSWERQGLGRINVAVNLSARQFQQSDLVAAIERILVETGIVPQQLELEITESLLMDDTQASKKALDDLKAMNLMIFLDDFGTGYSSLAYLKKFPIDGLKVDRSFILDIPDDPDDAAITRAIIALSLALRLKVVAEGVEQRRQADFLHEEGCHEAQGFYFSKPLLSDEFSTWISASRHPGPRH